MDMSVMNRWRISFPTVLTITRIILIPPIVYAMMHNWWGIACTFFVIAALTDILDGMIARWWNDKTWLGACLDPVADKLLILSCFFALTLVHGPLIIPSWFVAIVLIKELLLIAGTIAVFCIRGYIPIQPVFLGKSAMFVQTLFIMWLFACSFFHWMPIKTYYAMLGLVLITVCASFIHYVSICITWLIKA